MLVMVWLAYDTKKKKKLTFKVLRFADGTQEMDKGKFSKKNFVKDENLNTTRLQSLRLPRDLRLGGTKRKEYIPNLNASRTKNKPVEVTRSAEKRHGRIIDKFHKSKRDNQNGRFVQTEGIFTEGTAEIKRPSRHNDRNISYKERDTVATMVVPKISKINWNVNKADEDVVISDLLADSENSSDEDELYQPIALSGMKNEFLGVKREIKEESNKMVKSSASLWRCGFLEGEKYDEETPCISLITLPDSLAGKGGTGDPGDKNVDYPLKDMLEGRIGKLLVRKSGKMQVQIGNFMYDMESVADSRFCEDLMFVSNEEEWKSELEAAKLGQVREQCILTPSWAKIVL